MFTKCISVGDLIPYMAGPKDMRGDDREKPAENWRGTPELVTNLLGQQGFVRRKKRGPLWLRHNEQHLTHIISCFSESNERVCKKALPQAIKATERLFLAGLPESSLYFVWYNHPQKENTHAHAALVRSLLPEGGPYGPKLNGSLRLLFDRLASRALGLSDPKDPRHARLLMAGRASNRKANLPYIKPLIDEAHIRFAEGGLRDVEAFQALLEKHTFKVLSVPGPDGSPRLIKNHPKVPQAARYSNTVTTLTPGKAICCFTGPFLRRDFSRKAWEKEMKERERAVIELANDVGPTYQKFGELLAKRIQAQAEARDLILQAKAKDLIHGQRGTQLITEREFEWLAQPAKSLRERSAGIHSVNGKYYEFLCRGEHPDHPIYGQDIEYPFYCGLEPQRADITADDIFHDEKTERILFDEELDDPEFGSESDKALAPENDVRGRTDRIETITILSLKLDSSPVDEEALTIRPEPPTKPDQAPERFKPFDRQL
jgi:hypothetical protein